LPPPPPPTHPKTQCLDLHSRLSQKQRDTATAAFAKGNGVLLFASDVIARGMDFPDVTLVVQVGFFYVSNLSLPRGVV
jgi:ATP-dependent RNA helicase MSS116